MARERARARLRRHYRKICRVPLPLRREERNSDAYDPKVASFGPYHHGKEELQLGEEAKRLALEMFIDSSGQSRESLYQKVIQVIADARNCYIDGSTDEYSDEKFAEMMLLDGCFLIYLMGMGPRGPDRRLDEVFSLAFRDIVLMENQIPFQIVMLLINLIHNAEGETDKYQAVNEFLHIAIWGALYEKQQIQDRGQQYWKQKPPLHLLEAFHRVLLWDHNPQSQHEIDKQDDVDWKIHHYKTFRSAKDLKAKGIHFRPSRYKLSLRHIKFDPGIFYSQLQLPTWNVTSLSKVFFSNMIAYELCLDNKVADKVVISYVNFMKLLVVGPADVKELREKKILLTSLQIGCDEEVVRLYRELNTYSEYTYSFGREIKGIQDHYDSLAKTWMAQLINTYFSSPWSIMAWFGAILLLGLTILQTSFTINPK